MKKWLLALGVLIGLHSSVNAESADEITYEWLTSNEGNTHYIPHFKKIFSLTKVKTLLEFGMGNATKYFLDSCNKVISIDFITHGYGPHTLQHFLSFFQEFPNWIPIAFFSGYRGDSTWPPYKYLGSEHVYKACSYQTVTHKNYALIDDFYRLELNAFINSLFKCHKIDLAFVHPVLFLRSDLVELLFSKVNVIVATETQSRMAGDDADVYGYFRLHVPEDYEEIYLPGGSGTTVWVTKKESFTAFTENLKKYVDEYYNDL
jgi:hypothetical protein